MAQVLSGFQNDVVSFAECFWSLRLMDIVDAIGVVFNHNDHLECQGKSLAGGQFALSYFWCGHGCYSYIPLGRWYT